jgi:hypothetical protein
LLVAVLVRLGMVAPVAVAVRVVIETRLLVKQLAAAALPKVVFWQQLEHIPLLLVLVVLA